MLVGAGLLIISLLAATMVRPAAAVCAGDCNGDGSVTVDEVLKIVNIGLCPECSPSPQTVCASGIPDGTSIDITFIVQAVGYALTSCPASTPVSLVTGDYALTVAGDARSFTLTRRDEVLLSFPADALQLGTVDRLDESSSYDPYFLEPPNHAAAELAVAASDRRVCRLGVG